MIAILGATGYIGRSLARHWSDGGTDVLVLFARNPSALSAEPWPAHVSIRPLEDFSASGFSLVVNALGAGDPSRVASMGSGIIEVTRAWDQRVLDTMGGATRYVFLSSGIVYGTEFDRPVEATDTLRLPVNALGSVAPYVMAKLYAETVHRQAAERPILDIRVFGYADPAIDLAGRSFLSNLAASITSGQPFATSRDEMVRDYAGAVELRALIECWLAGGANNRVADLYTLAPVSKRELLNAAVSRYALRVEYGPYAEVSPTGTKAFYASSNRSAAALGYVPRRTSLEVVLTTLDAIVNGRTVP